MFIFDLIVLIHFLPFQKYGKDGFGKVIKWLMTPLTCYSSSIVFYLSKYLAIGNGLLFNPITGGIIVGGVFITVSRFLNKISSHREEGIIEKANRFNTYFFKIISISFSICFYVLSIIVLVISMKFFIMRDANVK